MQDEVSFSEPQAKYVNDLVDLKQWKYKNQFNARMLATCPVMPLFHSRHGEPLDDKHLYADYYDSKSINKFHLTRQSTLLLTRMDTYRVTEATREILVVDDYGMHVMFDCSLADMVALDEQLLKVGTFFIRKNEQELDLRKTKFPLVDRFQLIQDLYEAELDFQFAKAKLLMLQLEVYEHICDPLEA